MAQQGRRSYTDRQRERIFWGNYGRDGSHPVCNIPIEHGGCGQRVHPNSDWVVSHYPVPAHAGGTKVGVAHAACNHRFWCAVEAPSKAKSDRIQKRLAGKKKPRHPLPCGRESRWSKPIHGGPQPRMTLSQRLVRLRQIRPVLTLDVRER